MAMRLVSTETSALIDKTASTEWGLNPFALVEAAGRRMADKLSAFLGTVMRSVRIIAFMGSGNNSADALVMLKALILNYEARPANCLLVINRLPMETERTPRAEAFKALVKMGVPFSDFASWATSSHNEDIGIIVDGIAGTGLKGRLTGTSAEMVQRINEIKRKTAAIAVSIDVPSGLFDEWAPDMPVVCADVTLAVEPQKFCLYKPAARIFVGNIINVDGVFPQALVESFASKENAELFAWETAQTLIPKITPDVHKYQRGLVEIHAGCMGSAGAARIAAAGAQAVGAGLTRLLVDEALYPILAASAGGVMVATEAYQEDRRQPDAVLLGPGWGDAPDRPSLFEKTLKRAAVNGAACVLDADALPLFHAANLIPLQGTILTPHVGEFIKFAHISKETALSNPIPVLKKISAEMQTTILFKSHVLIVVDADGRIGVIDGETPSLAAGGSGDLLAGMATGLAARRIVDPFLCAVAAASLLVKAGKAMDAFTDPLELARIVSKLAFEAWGKR